jgi:hypothetical protein
MGVFGLLIELSALVTGHVSLGQASRMLLRQRAAAQPARDCRNGRLPCAGCRALRVRY